jgi:aminopeptidase-like protein
MIPMSQAEESLYQQMYAFAEKIFPFPRSITGNAVRQTLHEIKQLLPELTIHEVPTGTQTFDWQVPKEWNIRDAYVMDESGNRVIDWQKNNLHVVSYSTPVDMTLSLQELDEHLYSLPEQPDAIPYITSYYQPRWGFCIAQNKRQQLKEGRYRVVINSELEPGSLTYGELLLPGEESCEVLLSTYICHPSLANNECSGPVVTTFLAKWLGEQFRRRYSYRIVYIPETIGAVVYLSRHLEYMRTWTVAGFVVTCVGDNRAYSFMPSRLGNTIADKVALHILKNYAPGFISYAFVERGSDERQYCAPGVNLPVVSVMRTKYGEYPEYHTSLDDLSLISSEGLGGAYEILKKCLVALEHNYRYQVTVLCEPQLGKRGIYPTLSTKSSGCQVKDMMNLLVYCDGQHDLVDVAETIKVPIEGCYSIVDKLLEHGLLENLA